MTTPDVPLLCAMMRHVLDRLGPDAPASDLIDELKWEIARARLSYPPPEKLVGVVDAALIARSKGYFTPKGPRR